MKDEYALLREDMAKGFFHAGVDHWTYAYGIEFWPVWCGATL